MFVHNKKKHISFARLSSNYLKHFFNQSAGDKTTLNH